MSELDTINDKLLALEVAYQPEHISNREKSAGKLSQEWLEHAKHSTVRITSIQGDFLKQGSGFVLDEQKGLVATALHIVAGRKDIEVTGIDVPTNKAHAYKAELKTIDPDNDLAILKLSNYKSGQLKEATINSNAVISGQEIIGLGFPTNQISTENAMNKKDFELEDTFASGTKTHIDTLSKANGKLNFAFGHIIEPTELLTRHHIADFNNQTGMSGGPVYLLDKDNNYKIIGLTKGMLQYKQNTNKAANYIFDFVIPTTALNQLRQNARPYSKQELQQFNNQLAGKPITPKQTDLFQPDFFQPTFPQPTQLQNDFIQTAFKKIQFCLGKQINLGQNNLGQNNLDQNSPNQDYTNQKFWQGKSYQGLNVPSLQTEHIKLLIQRKQMLDSASK